MPPPICLASSCLPPPTLIKAATVIGHKLEVLEALNVGAREGDGQSTALVHPHYLHHLLLFHYAVCIANVANMLWPGSVMLLLGIVFVFLLYWNFNQFIFAVNQKIIDGRRRSQALLCQAGQGHVAPASRPTHRHAGGSSRCGRSATTHRSRSRLVFDLFA